MTRIEARGLAAIQTDALDVLRGGLDPKLKLPMAVGIYAMMAHAGPRFVATQANMARAFGCSRRTVLTYVQEFERLGLLRVERRTGAKGNIASRMILTDPLRNGCSTGVSERNDCATTTNGSSGGTTSVGGVQRERQQESNGTDAREGSIVGGDPFGPVLGSGAAAFAANPDGLLEEAVSGAESDVERVWAHYVEVMRKRKRDLPAEERALIRDALKVATPDELCAAIDGCASSAFHMGDNDRGNKYNQLPRIIKARRGHAETTRSRIEYFLELAENAPNQAGLSSVTAARVRQAKAKVIEGFDLPNDEIVQAMAAEAEQWLAEQGIRVKRSDVDRPTFE